MEETAVGMAAPTSGYERRLVEQALGGATPFESTPRAVGDLPPTDTFPGYELMREIHRGGQGVVYLAMQKATKRKVAVKVMHAGPFAGSKGRARFEREVQILGQLDHPNIVAIHDSGVTDNGSFFYVMDYISGRSLDEHVAAKKPPIDELLRLFIKIGKAVHTAHLKGVIHRDLKPGNVRVDQSGEPVVVDFGLAKVALPGAGESDPAESSADLMSITGQFIGSLPWASPEQAEGRAGTIDLRTDVYSLGVMLYQLLTDHFPYAVVGSMRDVLDHILRTEPTRPGVHRREIDNELETIVLKALRKEPERRYQSAGDLARDIERYLAGDAVEAKSDSGWYVIRKKLRRYRPAVAIAAAFLVLIIAFGVVMTVLYGQKSAAEKQAQIDRGKAEAASKIADEQRARAEANFAAVRALFTVFSGPFNESIANLRGATRARELLLDEADRYVSTLRDQAGDDPVLLREVAAGLDRVGDLYGALYMPTTGTLAEAARRYEASAEIRRALAAAQPDSADAFADMARSHYRIAGLKRAQLQYPEAEDEIRRSLTHADQALTRMTSDDPRRVAFEADRALFRVRLGDILHDRGERSGDDAEAARLAAAALREFQAVADEFRPALAAGAGSEEAARLLGIARDNMSRTATMLGARHRRAGLAARARGDAAAESRELDLALAQFAESRELATAALRDFEQLSAAAPASGQLRRDVWLAWHNVGLSWQEDAATRRVIAEGLRAAAAAAPEADRPAILAAAGEADTRRTAALESGLSAYTSARDIAEALSAADEANLQARRDVAVCLNKSGNMLRDLGRAEEALAAFRRSAEIRDELLATDPMQQHRRDVGVGHFKIGQMLAQGGDAAGARASFEKSLAQFEALRDVAVLADDSAELAEVRRELGRLADPGR